MLALTQCWFTRRHYPAESGHRKTEGVYRSHCRSCERPIISWDRSTWHLAEGFNLMQVYNSAEKAFLFLVDTRDDLVVARFPIDHFETEEEIQEFARQIRADNGVDEPGSMLVLRDSRGGRRKKKKVAGKAAAKPKASPAPVYPTEAPDALTGLPGRGQFEAAFALACGQAVADREALCVAFVDIDGLDRINRAHGLDAGDAVIRHVATVLAAEARAELHLSRNRGLEFILLMPGVTADRAAARLERLREAVAQGHPADAPGVTATISCGLAEVKPGDDPRAALRAADEALHQVKAGSDRLSIAGPQKTP